MPHENAWQMPAALTVIASKGQTLMKKSIWWSLVKRQKIGGLGPQRAGDGKIPNSQIDMVYAPT